MGLKHHRASTQQDKVEGGPSDGVDEGELSDGVDGRELSDGADEGEISDGADAASSSACRTSQPA